LTLITRVIIDSVTIITGLLIIGDVVTTVSEFTILSTLIGDDITVIKAVVTFLIVSSVMNAVTTHRVRTVSVTVCALTTVITVFVPRSVHIAITTARERTINVTLLALSLAVTLFGHRIMEAITTG
jgi:hypothetical protein